MIPVVVMPLTTRNIQDPRASRGEQAHVSHIVIPRRDMWTVDPPDTGALPEHMHAPSRTGRHQCDNIESHTPPTSTSVLGPKHPITTLVLNLRRTVSRRFLSPGQGNSPSKAYPSTADQAIPSNQPVRATKTRSLGYIRLASVPLVIATVYFYIAFAVLIRTDEY